MSQRKSIGLMLGVALAGLAIGATRADAAPSSKSSVVSAKAPGRSGKQRAAKPPQCPLRPGQDWPEAEDQKEATRYRHAILDGIFKQWIELGGAPTPAEFAQRMKLTQPEADRLLDQMQGGRRIQMKNQLVMLLAAAALGIAAVSPVSAAGKAPQSAKSTAADSKVIIPVEGLSCASCSFAVRRALKKMDGVKSIERGSQEDEALITYDASKVKPEQFVEAINNLGFKAGTPVKG